MSFHLESQAGKLNDYFDATNSSFMPALDAAGLPIAERVRLKAALKVHLDEAGMKLLPAVFLKLHPDFNDMRHHKASLWAVVDNSDDGPFLSQKQATVLAKIAALAGLPEQRLVLDLPAVSGSVSRRQRAERPGGRMRQWDALSVNVTRL